MPDISNPSRPRLLALHETGGHHVAFSARCRAWLDELAESEGFDVVYRTHADESLGNGGLDAFAAVFQMDFPPYGWHPDAAASFERAIGEGSLGWIGLHHASLLGEFDGYPMWGWFSQLLGGIRYKNYIADFAEGTVHVEDAAHPVMAGVPESFPVTQEEWYIYDRSPRPHVRVLATVDESSYIPERPQKMGDHPVVWTNEQVASRNLYIFMGHSPALFDNPAYVTLLRNGLVWAMGG